MRGLRHATRAGRGYLVGWFLATGVELVVVLFMIALWLWQVGGWRAIVGY